MVCGMTTTYAALLRGINVGGARKLPMAELRALLEELGHGAVRTHLQSGQAVFTSGHGDEDALAAELTRAIEKRFGFGVDVIVRDHAYLAAVAEACPFPADGLEPKQLHVTYFSGPVDEERFAGIDRSAFRPRTSASATAPCTCTRRRPRPLQARRGSGQAARHQGLIATTRNWNTVTKLVELTGA